MGEQILGGVVSFICAAIAVGADAQTEVRSRFGRRYGTFVARTIPGVLFISWWGLVDLGFYVIFLSNREWAKATFNIDVGEDLLWAGLVVGFSAILIIRTNLATVGSVQIGGEFLYTSTRSLLINSLNRKRIRNRRSFLLGYRPFFEDVAGHPNYFSSLRTTLVALADGSPDKAEILRQLEVIEANPPLESAATREALTGLVYDHFGPGEVASWATDTNYGN